MKERPILFSAPMVRAILEDRKTQTRRIIKPQPEEDWKRIEFYFSETLQRDLHPRENEIFFSRPGRGAIAIQCPYGSVGDRLWVRETHAWADELIDGVVREDAVCVAYRADKAILRHEGKPPIDLSDESWNLCHRSIKWRPSIHMPRWASRITLEITKVRVERLQDISEDDAKAEGAEDNHAEHWPDGDPGYINDVYRRNFTTSIWDSINGKGAWDKNPWVWVLEFKRL